MANEIERLVERLRSFIETEKKDRAALAKLKRGAADPFNNFEALSIIGDAIPDNSPKTFKNSMLLATLFAVHQKHEPEQSIGAALRKAKISLDVGQDSLDNRFSLLLNAEYEDLPHLLLQTCRFLANKEIGLDYSELYDSLKHWTHRDKFVQLRWAKDYWKYSKPKDEENTEENDAEIEENNNDNQ